MPNTVSMLEKWFLFSNSPKSNWLWLLGCVQLDLYETFYGALEDGGNCRVKEKNKVQHFLSSKKRQIKLARGPNLNSSISEDFPLKFNLRHT